MPISVNATPPFGERCNLSLALLLMPDVATSRFQRHCVLLAAGATGFL
jgi:hypothetical protein